MLNLNAIEEFIGDQQHFSSLTGNCGRKVRRFLEQTFPQGVARFTLKSQHEHLLQFAFNVGQMSWATLMAKQSLEHRDVAGTILFSLENIDQAAGTLDIVVTPGSIPEGVKARQEFLEHVAFGVRRVLAIGFLNQPHASIEEFLQANFGLEGATEPVDTSRYFAQFDKLLASDFSEIEDTSGYLTTLAGYLNPAVTAEVDRLEVEYDKAIEAAFAYHAMDSSTAIDRLFNQAFE
jgi:hypothetical protein